MIYTLLKVLGVVFILFVGYVIYCYYIMGNDEIDLD